MRQQKVISSILFIAFLVTIYVTYHSIESFRHHIRKEVKRKIKAGLKENEMTLLEIKNEDLGKLKWKHSKEFELDGQMYDVIKKEKGDGSIKYWCWWDNDETELNKRLNKMLVIALGAHPDQNERENFVDNGKTSMFWEDIAYNPVFLVSRNEWSNYLNNYQDDNLIKLFRPPCI